MNKQSKRKALGRGLSNLIPTQSEEVLENGTIVEIELGNLTTNPFQPRIDFDDAEIRGLAQSITNQGLLQPIVVRKKVDGYQIISGERRFRAVTSLGWNQVPCIVKTNVSDREMLEMALVENLQRENLNDIETAKAYQSLLLECSLSHEELSQKVGKSRAAITNAIRLLKLPESIQVLVRSGLLNMGHARALLSIEDNSRQKDIADQVVELGLSVRQVEELAQSAKPGGRKQRSRSTVEPKQPPLDPDLVQVLEKLQYRFGTTVRINVSAAKPDAGKLEILYHSGEDLNRILDVILP